MRGRARHAYNTCTCCSNADNGRDIFFAIEVIMINANIRYDDPFSGCNVNGIHDDIVQLCLLPLCYIWLLRSNSVGRDTD